MKSRFAYDNWMKKLCDLISLIHKLFLQLIYNLVLITTMDGLGGPRLRFVAPNETKEIL
jgi:hypothetical protein